MNYFVLFPDDAKGEREREKNQNQDKRMEWNAISKHSRTVETIRRIQSKTTSVPNEVSNKNQKKKLPLAVEFSLAV